MIDIDKMYHFLDLNKKEWTCLIKRLFLVIELKYSYFQLGYGYN